MKKWLCLILVVLAYLATGIYQVLPGEWAVVLRFGQPLQELSGPGLHYSLPWGLDRIQRVAVDEQRQLQLGYLDNSVVGAGPALTVPSLQVGESLTGDNQIVQTRITLFYRIDRQQLIRFVTWGARGEELLLRLAEEAITSMLATQQMNYLLLGRAVQLENHLRDTMMSRVQQYGLGVLIDSVNIVQAQPPEELVEVFRDVNRARTQREIAVTNALLKKNAQLSQARQEANQLLLAGQAYETAKLSQARSESQAFRLLVERFPRSPSAASAAILQLYLEEMQQILARMQVRTLSDQGMQQIVIVPLPNK